MDVRAENRGRPHQKVSFSAVPVLGRNFSTPGHPGVRVRNVRGKSGPKNLCLCCFLFPDLVLRLEPSYTGVSRASGPKSLKKSQKGVPGRPGSECEKSVEKVRNDPKKSQKDYKISVRGLFRHFFDTPGREAWEDLFETFCGFRGSGVWRLLYMGIAIAILVPLSHFETSFQEFRP